MRVAYIDLVGGAAGDMLLAALFDAGAPREPVVEAVSSVLGRRVRLGTREVRRRGLRALLLEPAEAVSAGLRRPRELLEAVDRASLADGVRSRSRSVLELLVGAETRAHGVEADELELAELGEDDTLLDVVGIAAALEALGVERLLVSPIPMPPPSGAGEHGAPAPVTLELLRGYALVPSAAGAELSETVTPTAAAVFGALGEPSPEIPAFALRTVGTGAGTRDPASVANVVRILLGDASSEQVPVRRLLVVEANVDDMSPELVPDAIDALLALGALDAWAAPILMKHGRPAVQVSALCEPGSLADVRRAFFETTTTLGVRVRGVDRPELERRVVEVALEEGGPMIRVKVGSLEGRAITAKPEHADVVEAAAKLGRSVRSVHAQATALAHGVLEEEARSDE